MASSPFSSAFKNKQESIYQEHRALFSRGRDMLNKLVCGTKPGGAVYKVVGRAALQKALYRLEE